MRRAGSHLAPAVRLWACALALLLALGCNAVFDISKGTPRPLCSEYSLIDDMEDGDGSICPTNGRRGAWSVYGDGTPGELNPSDEFEPSLIEGGGRDTSRYAARMWGSGFTAWGATLSMDFDSGHEGVGGDMIRFWMRSTTPIIIQFSTTETTPLSNGGECAPDDERNCYNFFSFSIAAPSRDWVEYRVPFNALRQDLGGSTIWKPQLVTGVQFRVPAGVEFDVSIDDLSFDYCIGAECQPPCTDPVFPVSCRAQYGSYSSCQPPGTNCDVVDLGLGTPTMVAMGGGDPACVGLPSDQLPRCFLNSSAGIPFATRVNPLTDGVANAQLRNPEPGKVCMRGSMGGLGAAAITFIVSPIVSDFPPVVSHPFDLQALDIQAIEFTITNAPSGGVSLQLRSLVNTECEPGFYCLGPVFSLGGPNARGFENGTVRAQIADFEPADPGPRLVLSFYFWGHSAVPLPTIYDFCLSDVKFLNSLGELVTPSPDGG